MISGRMAIFILAYSAAVMFCASTGNALFTGVVALMPAFVFGIDWTIKKMVRKDGSNDSE